MYSHVMRHTKSPSSHRTVSGRFSPSVLSPFCQQSSDRAGDGQGWECRGPARWAKGVMDPSPWGMKNLCVLHLCRRKIVSADFLEG